MPNKKGKKGGQKRCMAEGRRERTHAWRFEMKGHLRLRKNERKSITERNGDLVLLAGREEASGPPFQAR